MRVLQCPGHNNCSSRINIILLRKKTIVVNYDHFSYDSFPFLFSSCYKTRLMKFLPCRVMVVDVLPFMDISSMMRLLTPNTLVLAFCQWYAFSIVHLVLNNSHRVSPVVLEDIFPGSCFFLSCLGLHTYHVQ